MNMNFSYKTPDNNKALAELSFNMRNLNIGDVIKIIPYVPRQIETFQGNFNAQLNANWIIDSVMNIVPSSVESNASLQGLNLSVVKNQAIPKFWGGLMFGKSKDLKIDSIGFNIDVSNDILYVQPFQFSLNNYLLETTGLMRGNQMYYQVALLKSPLGLKFGVDIYGVPGKMHYRLCSTKQKTEAEILDKLDEYPHKSLKKEFGENIPGYKADEFDTGKVKNDFGGIYNAIRDVIYNSVPLKQDYIKTQHEYLQKQLRHKKSSKY